MIYFGQVEPNLLATMAVCVCAILFIIGTVGLLRGKGGDGRRETGEKRRKITVASFNALFMTLYDWRGDVLHDMCHVTGHNGVYI